MHGRAVRMEALLGLGAGQLAPKVIEGHSSLEPWASSIPRAPARATGLDGSSRRSPVAVALDSLGTGRPLAEADRRFFESRLRFDFSRVRVHTDGGAARAATLMNAAAFTVGREVVFGSGRYQPRSTAGRRLLAHELTHVVQQGSGGAPGARPVVQRRPEQPGVVDRVRLYEDFLAQPEADALRDVRALIAALEQTAVYFRSEGWKLPAEEFNRTWSRDTRVLVLTSGFSGPPRNPILLHNQLVAFQEVEEVARTLIEKKLDGRADLRDALEQAYVEALTALRASVRNIGAPEEALENVDAEISTLADRDFEVRDLPRNARTDPNSIYFERNSARIPRSEQWKIAPLAKPAARRLTVRGFASEDEDLGSTGDLISRRVGAVTGQLEEAGHDVDALVPRLKKTGETGRIDYRDVRKVTIVPVPVGESEAPSTEPVCGGPESTKRSCGNAFATAFPVAVEWTKKAVADLAGGTAPAEAELRRRFGGADLVKVKRNVFRILVRLEEVDRLKQFECHSTCDPACDSPAYIDHSPGGPKIVFCPGFLDDPDVDRRAETILHETTHIARRLESMRAPNEPPPEGTSDVAGRSDRAFLTLEPEKAIENADSYVALIRLIHTPGSIAVGRARPDQLQGGDPNRPERGREEDAARRALAYLEQWVYWGREDTSYTYSSIVNALSEPSSWPSSANDRFGRSVLHQIAGIFSLTDPGEADPPAALPTVEDKVKMAAIYDRFETMFSTMWGYDPVVMTRAAGPEAWAAGLARRVQVRPSFFEKAPLEQVRHLVFLMATAMPNISPGFRQKYVAAADQIRKGRDVGP